jgi:hypothetical protein
MDYDSMIAKKIGRMGESSTIAISQKANLLRQQGVNVISLAVGEPDFDTRRLHPFMTGSPNTLPLMVSMISKKQSAINSKQKTIWIIHRRKLSLHVAQNTPYTTSLRFSLNRMTKWLSWHLTG